MKQTYTEADFQAIDLTIKEKAFYLGVLMSFGGIKILLNKDELIQNIYIMKSEQKKHDRHEIYYWEFYINNSLASNINYSLPMSELLESLKSISYIYQKYDLYTKVKFIPDVSFSKQLDYQEYINKNE